MTRERQLSTDPIRLQQILTNYLSNAAKYSFDGDTIVLKFTDSPKRGVFRLAVQDQGPGIRSEFQGRLFERFARDPSQKGNGRGTGLGLAIAQELAQLLGGQVGFHSKPGVLTEFYVDLPRSLLKPKKQAS